LWRFARLNLISPVGSPVAFEIERKFLTISDAWRDQVRQTLSIRQAYLANTGKASVRVRISDDQGYICSKSMTVDIRRHEFEYPIPVADADFMIEHMCQGSAIIKQRHLAKVGDHLWEIDEFAGDNQGLIVAEIELAHETDSFQHPSWLGAEVSHDPRYFNMALVEHPFRDWTT
jgi:adenylate cyclase